MQIVITHRQNITAKNTGDKFLILRGISRSGDTVELFMNQEMQEKFPVSASAMVAPDALASFFDSVPTVEVEFNQKGRVESLSV